jgi:chemotaxis protein methyltransferase CheR
MSLSTCDFNYVRGIVRQHSAISLDDSKVYLAETRLVALARQEGISSITELVARLRVDQGRVLRQKVVEAMTTNETSFFRDIHPFEAIQQVLLPELSRRRAGVRRLNVWSAACSTGQEPYSLAMLLRDHFPELNSWQLRILASDLSSEVLERARAGRYTQLEVNRGMPAHLLVRYFKRHALDWSLIEEIRRMIDFQVINLIDAWPPMPLFDLILIRNVLIYFDPEAKRRVLDRIGGILAPDGYLILGGSETTFFNNEMFERVDVDRCCIYQLKSQRPYAGPHLYSRPGSV